MDTPANNASTCGRIMQGGRICCALSREAQGPCNKHFGRPDSWQLCPKGCGHSLRRNTRYELCAKCAPSIRVMDSQKKTREARDGAIATAAASEAALEASRRVNLELEETKAALAIAIGKVTSLEMRLEMANEDIRQQREAFQSYIGWSHSQGSRFDRS